MVKIGWMVLEKNILKVVNVFSISHYYLSLEKGVVLRLNKSISPEDVYQKEWLTTCWTANIKIDKSNLFITNNSCYI